MAPLPPLGPTPPEPSGARVLARTSSTLSDEIIRKSDAAAIFVKLRKMIASDTQSTETILGTIAVAAQTLTGATGAALAMPHDGVVVCVGRSGETAPELGDRLDVDSGISGECLRTGVSLRCDDASRDFHVDAEVCREMGLQSIAVVPLRGQYGRVGVLEAFSTAAYAFDEDKMEVLGRLAGLAEAAWARGMVPVSPAAEAPVTEVGAADAPVVAAKVAAAPVVVPPAVEDSSKASTVALERVGDAIATGRYRERATELKWRYSALAGLGVVILFLLSLLGWKTWYKASIESRPGRTAASRIGSGGNRASHGGSGACLATRRRTPGFVRQGDPGAREALSGDRDTRYSHSEAHLAAGCGQQQCQRGHSKCARFPTPPRMRYRALPKFHKLRRSARAKPSSAACFRRRHPCPGWTGRFRNYRAVFWCTRCSRSILHGRAACTYRETSCLRRPSTSWDGSRI